MERKSWKEKFSDFSETTSLHGLDLIKNADNWASKIFWILFTAIGTVLLLLICVSSFETFLAQKTGVNQKIVAGTGSGLPAIKICYDAYLPLKPSYYPRPVPKHVATLMQLSETLGRILDYASGLYRPLAEKSRQDALAPFLGNDSEDDVTRTFIHQRPRRLRQPGESQLKAYYDRLMEVSKSSSFAELIVKLLPFAPVPLVLQSTDNAETAWMERRFLITNQRSICHIYVPDGKQDEIEFLIAFPPIVAEGRGRILGSTSLFLLDPQGVTLAEIQRPMTSPAESISPSDPAYGIALGSLPESSVSKQFSLIERTLRFQSTEYQLESTRAEPCKSGLEPSPTVRDRNSVRAGRSIAIEASCRPMDELMLDLKDTRGWDEACDPWELQDIEEASLLLDPENYPEVEHFVPQTINGSQLWCHVDNESGCLNITDFPACSRMMEEDILFSVDHWDTAECFDGLLNLNSTAPTPEDKARFQSWTNRKEGDEPVPLHCQTVHYKLADERVSSRSFITAGEMLEKAMFPDGQKESYAALLEHNFGDGMDAELHLVRLAMRDLTGDHILVEQFLALTLGGLLSQLGGFLGLFLGGSIISLVHLISVLVAQTASSVRRKVGGGSDPKKAKYCRLTAWLLASSLLIGLTISAAYLVFASTAEETTHSDNEHSLNPPSYEFKYDEENQLSSCGWPGGIIKMNFSEQIDLASHPAKRDGLPYPRFLRCEQKFESLPKISFLRAEVAGKFDTEENQDILAFFEGFDDKAETISKCSGNTCEFIVTKGRRLRILFVTDRTDSRNGFVLRVMPVTECGMPEPCIENGIAHPNRPACMISHCIFIEGGKKNTTKTGQACDDRESDSHTLKKLGSFVYPVKNFCANTDSSITGPWCNTGNGTTWDQCFESISDQGDVDYIQTLEDKRNDLPCLTDDETKARYGSPSCKTNAIVFREVSRMAQPRRKTLSGRECQAWNADEPHKITHDGLWSWYFGVSPSEAGNLCLNPYEDSAPWCFTTDPEVEWEYCFHPDGDFMYGEQGKPDQCLADNNGGKMRWSSGNNLCIKREYIYYIIMRYNGRSHTRTGTPCQKWAAKEPHSHNFMNEKYWDFGVSAFEAGNQCANPDEDEDGPWCFTTDPEVRYDYCFYWE